MNNVFYSTPVVSGATSYSWSASSPTVVTAGQGSTGAYFNFGTSTQSLLVCVTAANSCFSRESCLAVRPYPKTPNTIYGPAKVCPNTTVNVYVTAATYPVTYTWTTSGSNIKIVGGQGTPSASVYWGTNQPGYVHLTLSNACGNTTISRYYTGSCTAFASSGKELSADPGSGTPLLMQRAGGIQLQLPAGYAAEDISIYNAAGIKLVTEPVRSRTTVYITCGKLPGGIYFISTREKGKVTWHSSFFWPD